MLIVRTPHRVSLLGGSTDFPSYYSQNEGMVFGFSLAQYSYLSLRKLPPFFDYKTRLSYSKIELINNVDEIEHRAIRGILKHYNINDGLEIGYTSDIPAKSGMGSSSTFVVGLLNGINTLFNRAVPKKDLAKESIFLEREQWKETGGIQDSVWAAFGGLNQITFSTKYKGYDFAIHPILLRPDFEQELLSSILLVYTGINRISSNITDSYINTIKNTNDAVKRIAELSEIGLEALKNENLPKLAQTIDEAWQAKRGLSNSVSNTTIDMIYKVSKDNGALGFKVLGAGGGGVSLIMADKENIAKIAKELSHFIQLPVKIDWAGSKILYQE